MDGWTKLDTAQTAGVFRVIWACLLQRAHDKMVNNCTSSLVMPERKRRAGSIDLKPPEEDLRGWTPPLSHVLLLSLSHRFMKAQGSNESPDPPSLLALSAHSSNETRSQPVSVPWPKS